MMKKLVFLLILINTSLVVVFATGYYLSETYPFHITSPFFGVQALAEDWRIALTQEPVRQVEMRFELVERRLSDLARSSNHADILPALQAFDDALTAAMTGLENLPSAMQEPLFHNIKNLMVRADLVLAGLGAYTTDRILPDLQAKVQLLNQAATLSGGQVAVSQFDDGKLSMGLIIPFLKRDVDHGDFPMDGGHAIENCLACHEIGVYAKTPTTCEVCHAINTANAPGVEIPFAFRRLNAVYPEHFSGACSDCHTTESWAPVAFDHREVRECTSCHAGDLPGQAAVDTQITSIASLGLTFRTGSGRPSTLFALPESAAYQTATHYPGDCKLCHFDTANWAKFNYRHDIPRTDFFVLDGAAPARPIRVAKNCSTCHVVAMDSTAAGHQTPYEANCTLCHQETRSWQVINFDHAARTDCETCHASDKPKPHFPGDCAVCHSTRSWKAINYTHVAGSACLACHIKPRNHYPGTCTSCHTPTNWYESIYQHSAASDCAQCHQAPDGHAVDQCSTCHTTQNWNDNAIYHALQACAACHNQPANHYPGTCTMCHRTQNWEVVDLDHSGLTTCTDCHPIDPVLGIHYGGECSNCHGTHEWQNAIFNHVDLFLCAVCHQPPDLHFAGDCLSCHTNTNDWFSVDFNHLNLNACLDCHVTPTGHYPGTCSLCHSTMNWDNASYTHVTEDKCTACHVAPAGHWPGQCSNCHFTDTWLKLDFDHTVYTDCKSCHLRPSGHPRGQCSNCHTTDSWMDIVTKTPSATIETPEPTDTPTPTEETPEPRETPTPDP